MSEVHGSYVIVDHCRLSIIVACFFQSNPVIAVFQTHRPWWNGAH